MAIIEEKEFKIESSVIPLNKDLRELLGITDSDNEVSLRSYSMTSQPLIKVGINK